MTFELSTNLNCLMCICFVFSKKLSSITGQESRNQLFICMWAKQSVQAECFICSRSSMTIKELIKNEPHNARNSTGLPFTSIDISFSKESIT